MSQANRSQRLGHLVLSTCLQGAGAPVIDGCTVSAADGTWTAGGVTITPRRAPSRALVIGWVGAPCPRPMRWRWLPATLRTPR